MALTRVLRNSVHLLRRGGAMLMQHSFLGKLLSRNNSEIIIIFIFLTIIFMV